MGLLCQKRGYCKNSLIFPSVYAGSSRLRPFIRNSRVGAVPANPAFWAVELLIRPLRQKASPTLLARSEVPSLAATFTLDPNACNCEVRPRYKVQFVLRDA